MTIVCGIDLGTNSFRLLVAKYRQGQLVPLAKALATVCLGEGLSASGAIAPAALARGLAALQDFGGEIRRHRPEQIRICGTHALRVAKNREDFLAAATAILGSLVEVIPPAEEAALSLAGAQLCLEGDPPILLADVGGGSSELVWRDGDGAIQAISVAAGAVSLTERFLPNGAPAGPETLANLRHAIAALFAGTSFPKLSLVGSGGTATACAALDLGLTVYEAGRVQGHHITRSRLQALLNQLAELDGAGRNRLPGLDQGRGEIVLAGALIYEHLLACTEQDVLMVSDAGLLEGIALSSLVRPPASQGTAATRH